MKKLFLGLATSFILCFAASSADAQVRDTMDRQNNGNIEQQTWPADSNKRDSVDNVTPAPNNPTTSDTTNRNNGITVPSDRNMPNGNGNGNGIGNDNGNGIGNGNDMTPGSRTDTPPTPNTPNTAPGTSTNPRPQSDIPNAPRPNTSPNSPTTPTTGSPM